MVIRRNRYDTEDIKKSVEDLLLGLAMKDVFLKYPDLPESTIIEHTKLKISKKSVKRP
jgi:hypothetical protein